MHMRDVNHIEPILAALHVDMTFHGLHALEGYELYLKEHEILGVIGPNGAGKTTLFNVFTGYLNPTRGQILFNNIDITNWRPDRIATTGIARTFQTIRLFNGLTVLENAKVAVDLHAPRNFFTTAFSVPEFIANEREIEAQAFALLDLFHLSRYAEYPASKLAYGDQRRLEIVRALATNPKLLLLDEPAAGMNPVESEELMQLILNIREKYGCTIILVEHDMRLVMQLCERIQVLNYGKLIAEGPPGEIRANPTVIEAYLGKTNNHAEN